MRARDLSGWVCGCAMLIGWPVLAAAQTSAASPSPPSTRAASGVEFYGGLSLGRFSRGGTLVVPPPGAPIATSSPVFPSWSVPTWLVGDGAALLNTVAAEFGIAGRLAPLDAALRARGVSDAGHVLAGARVRRPITPGYTLELGAELSAQGLSLSQDLRAALDEAADSFVATFTELLGTGPFTAAVVEASVASATGAARDLTLTAALNAPAGRVGAFEGYAVAGGGLVVPMGGAASATVTGRYRFTIDGAVPVDETDALTVRYRQRATVVGIAGGGLRRAITNRLAVRIDVRMLIGPGTTTVTLDSSPNIVTGTPAGFIESFTYPNLQFSNHASTGRRSTLGSPGLSDFDAFTGGWTMRGRVTVGIEIRY